MQGAVRRQEKNSPLLFILRVHIEIWSHAGQGEILDTPHLAGHPGSLPAEAC